MPALAALVLMGLVAPAALTQTATAVPDSPGAAQRVAAPGTPAASPLYNAAVLFIDNHRVETLSNVRRLYNPGTKMQVGDLPRGQVNLTPSVKYTGGSAQQDLRDGDIDRDARTLLKPSSIVVDSRNGKPLYRMYLRTGSHTGYRESTDGLNWKIRDPDSVVIVKDTFEPTVFKDTGDGRYYMLGWDPAKRGYAELVSNDGVHFTRTTKFSGVLSTLGGDVVHAAFDPVQRQVIAVAKQRSTAGPACGAAGTRGARVMPGGRTFGVSVSASVSSNARAWAGPYGKLTADCTDELSTTPVGTRQPVQFYGMPFSRYGDQLIGFPWVFRITAQPESLDAQMRGYTDGPVDTEIASSSIATGAWRRSDPALWHGVPRRPALIQRGPAGSWDAGMIFAVAPIVTLNGRTVIYYGGFNKGHLPVPERVVGTGAASWRKDSMVGLQVADGRKSASMTTKPFVLGANAGARNLYVNAQIPRGKSLRVQVLYGPSRTPLASYSSTRSTVVTGDQTAAMVRWSDRGLGQLRNKHLRLRFTWTGGTIYSMQVR